MTATRLTLPGLVAALLLSGGCGGAEAEDLEDAGAPADSGPTLDAGRPPDAGEAALDAGESATDAGESAIDAGGATLDAGEAVIDAGESAIDAGEAAIDAGGAAIDAGEAAIDAGEAAIDAGEAEIDAGAPDPATLFAEQFVAAHNQVRAAAEPAPHPALPPLQWSADLAQVAQAWADQCNYRHNPGADMLGENLAAAAPPSGQPPSWVVGFWASEAANYDYATNECAPGEDCGHYTQLVWRDTTSVGCATRICSVNSPFGGDFPTWQIWVCDYDPPGNWIGESPY